MRTMIVEKCGFDCEIIELIFFFLYISVQESKTILFYLCCCFVGQFLMDFMYFYFLILLIALMESVKMIGVYEVVFSYYRSRTFTMAVNSAVKTEQKLEN